MRCPRCGARQPSAPPPRCQPPPCNPPAYPCRTCRHRQPSLCPSPRSPPAARPSSPTRPTVLRWMPWATLASSSKAALCLSVRVAAAASAAGGSVCVCVSAAVCRDADKHVLLGQMARHPPSVSSRPARLVAWSRCQATFLRPRSLRSGALSKPPPTLRPPPSMTSSMAASVSPLPPRRRSPSQTCPSAARARKSSTALRLTKSATRATRQRRRSHTVCWNAGGEPPAWHGR